jgi:cytochrome c oxidase subunit 4
MAEHTAGHHPSDSEYVRVATILAILTAAEVSTFYVDFGWASVPMLIILMSVKFFMVAGIFMHLKFDTKLYRMLVTAGLFLAIGLYTIMLMTFFSVPGFFDSFK